MSERNSIVASFIEAFPSLCFFPVIVEQYSATVSADTDKRGLARYRSRSLMERPAKKSDCKGRASLTLPFFLRHCLYPAKIYFYLFISYSGGSRAAAFSPTRSRLCFVRSRLSKKYHDYFNSRWYCRPIDEQELARGEPEPSFILYGATYPCSITNPLPLDSQPLPYFCLASLLPFPFTFLPYDINLIFNINTLSRKFFLFFLILFSINRQTLPRCFSLF